MATADFVAGPVVAPLVADNGREESKRYHRVRDVRLQQGVSLRSASRQIGTDVRSLRIQEMESTDLRISELKKWQKALDVPLSELVVDTDEPLSRPVMERARLIRLMKTAQAIHENSPNDGLKRMAETMVNQLVEIMPELREVSPWHTYGQRRSMDEFGRAAERQISDDFLRSGNDDD